MEQVKYGTNASCSPDYPINLHAGAFSSPGGEIIVINERELNGPWGVGGVAYIVGDGFNPLPNRLRVGYFSDTENEFFEGEFDLPYDKLKQLFAEESDIPFYKGKLYRDEQSGRELKRMKYNAINVGIALGGLVVVWVSGEGVQTIVGNYKAKVADIKWNNIYDTGSKESNREYNLEKVFTDKVKQEVLTNRLPVGLWETYLRKYNWKYALDFGNNQKAEKVHFKMLNAEAVSLYSSNGQINTDSYSTRAIPYAFDMVWDDLSGKKYGARVVFNAEDKYYQNIYNSGGVKILPDELNDIESYRIINQLDKTKPIDIVFKIDSSNTGMVILFRQADKEIKAENVTIKVFEKN